MYTTERRVPAFSHMYSLVRRYIKTAIAFLAAGPLLGVYLIVQREISGVWPRPYLATAHTHAILVGFMMFMVLGVALWLFPRTKPDDTSYRPGRPPATNARAPTGSTPPSP